MGKSIKLCTSVNNQSSIINSQFGQTLIEVVVALTAAVIIIAAIVSASLNALTNSDYARDQNLAIQYTQAGMEIVRDMRNESIASLSAAYLPDDTYCLAKACSALDAAVPQCWIQNTSCGQNFDKFIRQVVVVHNSADCNVSPTPNGQPGSILSSNVKITVETSWYDTKCTDPTKPFCHNTIISSCFSDFTVLPTP